MFIICASIGIVNCFFKKNKKIRLSENSRNFKRSKFYFFLRKTQFKSLAGRKTEYFDKSSRRISAGFFPISAVARNRPRRPGRTRKGEQIPSKRSSPKRRESISPSNRNSISSSLSSVKVPENRRECSSSPDRFHRTGISSKSVRTGAGVLPG